MRIKHNIILGLSLTLLSLTSLAQYERLNIHKTFKIKPSGIYTAQHSLLSKRQYQLNSTINTSKNRLNKTYATFNKKVNKSIITTPTFYTNQKNRSLKFSGLKHSLPKVNLGFQSQEDESFLKNRRNVYSSMWAFASLNYLYADLVGLMDANIHAQYESGVVEGTRITPGFLTVAAGFMQIPIANVFLPHLIKNEKALRWVQIASGTIMTLVQSGTLFIGTPTPHYALFSAFEIAATSYITIDAIRWKPKPKTPKQLKNN